MSEFLKKVFSSWVYWLCAVFTVLGVIYSIGSNRPWLGFSILLPITFALFERSYRIHREGADAVASYETEKRLRVEAEGRLATLPAEYLQQMQNLLIRGNLEQHLEGLTSHIEYLARLQHIKHREFPIVEVTAQGGALYVIAKVEVSELPHHKIGDPFVLVNYKSGVGHEVAFLKVHQTNPTEGSIFFRAIEVRDDTIFSSLLALSQQTGVKGLNGFTVKIDVKDDGFAECDMGAAHKAMQVLRRRFENMK